MSLFDAYLGWASSVLMLVSQILTVLSHDPEARSLLSGENATEVTKSECSSSTRMIEPWARSQIRMVLSFDPEARRLLSGENATELTSSVCSANTRRITFLVRSQTRTVESLAPEASIF